mgnify:CR=1 FL=1
MTDEELRTLIEESVVYAKANAPAKLHVVDIEGKPRLGELNTASKYDGRDIWDREGWSKANGVRAFVRKEDAERFYKRRLAEYARWAAAEAKRQEAKALRARAEALDAEANAL